MEHLTKIFAMVIFASFISASFAQEKKTEDHKMNDHKMMHDMKMMKDSSHNMMMDSSKMMMDSSKMMMDSSKMMINDESNMEKNSMIRTGVIDLQAIDENKDGKVYQDMMDWNVISDEAGECPLCGMTLKEVTVKKAKENLLKHNYKVK